jgi:ABC-type bacteriocin/lantibiotic exporter with double-glycine peptidase domain
MQNFDYSCGAAALATLMRSYFHDPVNEGDLLQELLGQLSPAELKDRVANGFSLYDLKTLAERHGYQAVGVQLTPEVLRELSGPVLIHLEKRDFKHFAVLKGVIEDRVYLADPSRGNIRMPLFKFLEEWKGFALVLGREGFGLPKDHPLAIRDTTPMRRELRAVRKSFREREVGVSEPGLQMDRSGAGVFPSPPPSPPSEDP